MTEKPAQTQDQVQAPKPTDLLQVKEAVAYVNTLVTGRGFPEIRYQMVRNYVVKNMIPSTKGTDGKARIKRSDLDAWVKKYLGRKVEAYNKIKAALEGQQEAPKTPAATK